MAQNTNEDDVVVLEPFIHQVGGRSTILMYGHNVCKPSGLRELNFYESLPQELKPFVPEYHGIIEVYFDESSDGYLTITAKPPDDHKNLQFKQNTKHRIRLCKQMNKIIIESNEQSQQDIDSGHSFEDGSTQSNNDLTELTNNLMTKHNPWVLKTFSRLCKTDNNQIRKCVLLENLTSKFRYPCVMDLKMGVRQYDDNASESKILSHSLKVAETTSGALGLRITGIQVYNKSLDRFICHNKYYGRSLDTEGLKTSLKKFLQNDINNKVNIIELLIKRLQVLLSVVVKLETFRFYTSSLLILYEGMIEDIDLETNRQLIDIRMIDFAHSTHPFMNMDSTVHKGPDRGYIFGLKNLIKLLRTIDNEKINSSH